MVKAKRAHTSGNAETAKLLPKVARAVFLSRHPTVHIGTWENHIAPDGSFQQAEEARRKYGDMVVGLTYSRGVVGVMPGESPRAGTLEGVSSKTQRDE